MQFKIDFRTKNIPATMNDVCGRKSMAKEWYRNLELERKAAEEFEFYPDYFFALTRRRSHRFTAIMNFYGKGVPTFYQWYEFTLYIAALEMEAYCDYPVAESQFTITVMEEDKYEYELDKYDKEMMRIISKIS